VRYDESGAPIGLEDHVTEGESLQVQVLTKPRLQAMLRSYLREVQVIEVAAWGMFTGRMLPNATGATLATWGRIVGELRGGDSETIFRTRISVRIRVNRSRGTIPDLYQVAKLAFNHSNFAIVAHAKTVAIHVFEPVTSGIPRATLVAWFIRAKVAGDSFRLHRSADANPMIVRSKRNPITTNGIDSKTGAVPAPGKIMGEI